MTNDFNNSDSGPSLLQHMFLILFLPKKKSQKRRILLEIFIVVSASDVKLN